MIAKSTSRFSPIYFEPVEFKPHPDFRKPKCIAAILGPMPDQEAYDIERRKIRSEAESVKSYIRATYQEPILNAAQEVHLFKKYNYLKYQAALIQKTFKKDFRVHRRRKFRHLLRQAEGIRNQIAAANYRLGVNIVSKLRNNYVSDDELVNEAYLRIWLVIPKFDLKYGWKFSTYATYAVTNNLTQKFRQDSTFHNRYSTGTEPDRLLNDDFIVHNDVIFAVKVSKDRTVTAKLSFCLCKL
jgi:DNA-directed RNA polymerase specialized sigma24 family protein